MTKKSCCISFQSPCPDECAVIDDTIGLISHLIPMQVAILSHDYKSQDAPHLDHIDLVNAMLSLTLPLASHKANTGTNGVKLPNKLCCTLFKSS